MGKILRPLQRNQILQLFPEYANKKELPNNYYLKAKHIKNNIIKDKDKLDDFINKYDKLYL